MPDGHRVRVVLAEDDYLVSLDVTHAIKQAGYDVVGHATDGAQALTLVREARPDVVIMDIQMSGMSGLEAAAALRDSTPVVILTAFETAEFLEQAKRAGVGAYLTKPPAPSSIRNAVEVAVARHGDLMELRRVNAELQATLSRVKTLEGMLPICATCKSIRGDDGRWVAIELYVKEHSGADFTHGICPDCLHRIYPEYADGL